MTQQAVSTHYYRSDKQPFIADSPIMKRVLQHARRAASVDTMVLVSGEPGTGKTLLATEIHKSSHRRHGPFVHYYASDSMPGGTLFGSADGTREHPFGSGGAVHRATTGTLLIHEIAALDLTDQARLLTMIENAVTPASQEQLVDTRLIATTSRDLNLEVKAGRFRNDLLYRVSVLPIRLPPLRLRREDIPALVSHFLDQHPEERTLRLESQLVEVFTELDWPGNIRQLKRAVESMITSSQRNESIGPLDAGKASAPLAAVEKDMILAALDSHDGNRTRTAESLGISVRTLQRRLRQWHHEK